MSILLVDNEPHQIDALKRYLLSHGYQVLEAADGKEAVRQLDRHAQGIELVITDYLMPGLDGLGLLEEVRRRDTWLPVIFMTAYADKDVVIQALRHSCDGFLEKPFTPEQLLREIKRIQEQACQKVSERLSHQRKIIADFMGLPPGDGRLPQEMDLNSDQLLQLQKMGLLGSMTSGIAHDFNNLLQAILGRVDLLMHGEDQEQLTYADLREVAQAAESGAELVKQLLSFSRQNDMEFQPLNLNQVIQRLERLVRRTVPRMIEVQMDLAEDLKPISAVPVQIEQLLINLVFNARDAMPAGGKLTLATKNVTLNEETDHGEGAKPGEYVQLTVADTGSGIPEEMLTQIFQPFFTTKGLGKGTGLGLFMVKAIVNRHRGLISCISAPGSGTIFAIDLPVWQDKVSLPDEPDKEIAPTKINKGAVLLVEDDESVRAISNDLLEASGYTVLPAGNGEEALEIFRRRQNSIDLVLLDLLMPGMGGKQCLTELLKINPQPRVIIMSGCDNGTVNEAMAAGARGILSKPYKMEQLLQAVRQVMDQG